MTNNNADTSYWYDIYFRINNLESKLPVEYVAVMTEKIRDMIEEFLNKEAPGTLVTSYECVDVGFDKKGEN